MQNSFFQELLQRKVFRGIAVYVVVAWLIMQAAEIVLPAFDLPNWTLRFVIIGLVLGLPVVAVLSWAFDLSSKGLQRESKVRRTDPAPGKVSRTVDFVLIGVLAVLASYFGWHYFTTGSALPEAIAAEPSIAVLPFVNMSDDRSNDYFSDGISEELLNALAKVPGLKVAGRTSSFFYKDKNQDLRTIGEQLGVANVLEGCVRKSNDRVRVTAQLVSTSDGFHLWSDTFDHELDDIFKVQDEIAQAVVIALKGKLFGEQMAATPAERITNPTAYAFYLQGRDGLHQRRKETVVRAETLFKQALQADPDYAPALVGLSESYMLQHINHRLGTLEEAEAKAIAAVERALVIDPDSAEAHAALGLVHLEVKRYDQAETAFARSLELNPGYAEALHWYGLLHRWRGEFDLAYAKLKKSTELDPLHRVARSNFGQLLITRGNFDEARAFFERSIELTPEFSTNYASLAGVIALGPMPRPAEAIPYLDQAIALEPDKGDYRHYKTAIQLEMDDVAGALETLAQYKQDLPDHALAMISEFAIICYVNGDQRGAEYLLEKLRTVEGLEDGFQNAFRGIANVIVGDYDEALAALEAVDPQLAADKPRINSNNLQFARLMAVVHTGLGNSARREQIFEGIEEHLQYSSRFGPEGYQLADVEIAILRDQPDLAMAHFKKAYDEGFRSRTVEGLWRLADYPALEPIKDRPGFVALVDMIERYHEQQKNNLD